jgi:hypothetical protein
MSKLYRRRNIVRLAVNVARAMLNGCCDPHATPQKSTKMDLGNFGVWRPFH